VRRLPEDGACLLGVRHDHVARQRCLVEQGRVARGRFSRYRSVLSSTPRSLATARTLLPASVTRTSAHTSSRSDSVATLASQVPGTYPEEAQNTPGNRLSTNDDGTASSDMEAVARARSAQRGRSAGRGSGELVYLDASALVKRYVAEVGSGGRCRVGAWPARLRCRPSRDRPVLAGHSWRARHRGYVRSPALGGCAHQRARRLARGDRVGGGERAEPGRLRRRGRSSLRAVRATYGPGPGIMIGNAPHPITTRLHA
jgi:hypothetical protein